MARNPNLHYLQIQVTKEFDEAIKALAKRDKRSKASEIVHLLESGIVRRNLELDAEMNQPKQAANH